MAEPETKAQAAEAAAIRRRWITLGEVLAVIAVVISGLTLWNSYQDREAQRADRAADKEQDAEQAQTLLLRGNLTAKGNRLEITAGDADQAIQSQTIAFPAALGADVIDTVIQPRIEAAWIKEGLGKARRRVRDDDAGDLRLPISITTRFESGGTSHTDTAIYDVGYKLEKGFLDDTDVILRGLSLVERTGAARAQAALDALWAKRQPTISPAEKK